MTSEKIASLSLLIWHTTNNTTSIKKMSLFISALVVSFNYQTPVEV